MSLATKTAAFAVAALVMGAASFTASTAEASPRWHGGGWGHHGGHWGHHGGWGLGIGYGAYGYGYRGGCRYVERMNRFGEVYLKRVCYRY